MEHLLPMLIPITGIVFGCSIPVVIVIVEARRKRQLFELHHRERMAAIEKGVELPPLPSQFFGDEPRPARPPRYLLRGLVWLMIGLGITLGGGSFLDTFHPNIGLIPGGIGLAYLIYYFAEGRRLQQLEVDRFYGNSSANRP